VLGPQRGPRPVPPKPRHNRGLRCEDIGRGPCWRELSGDVGLGFTAPALAIDLVLYGPPAGVDLRVADVEFRPLTAP